MSLTWLTNCHKGHDREFIEQMKRDGKTIGEPKGTEKFSVDKLRDMGMVGVYKMDKEIKLEINKLP